MNDRHIGEYGWVNDYVGLHYEVSGRSALAIDCWGLVCLIYREQLGINLPDWVTDENIDWETERGEWTVIDSPTDMCLVRSQHSGSIAGHWGIFVAGGVISADVPNSNFVPFERYCERHPDPELGVFSLAEGTLS